jgi:hypothetical protein
LSGTQVSDEVDKYKSEAKRCKNEADKRREEVEKYNSKLERQKMKLWSVERKYKFSFVCSWVIFLLLLVYSQSHRQCNASRMMFGMKLFCNGVMPCNVVSVGRILFKGGNWFVIVSRIMNFP